MSQWQGPNHFADAVRSARSQRRIRFLCNGDILLDAIQARCNAGSASSSAKLGSGLVDHSQKNTVAARARAEKKTVEQRS